MATLLGIMLMALNKEQTQQTLSASLKSLSLLLNIAIIAMIGVVVYLQKDVSNAIILGFAVLILARSIAFFFESKQLNFSLKNTFRMVGMDLGKATFGLVISIALVYIMKILTGVGGGF